MASGPGVSKGQLALDLLLAGGALVRLWTVAPAFDGTGGAESVPAGGAPSVTFQPSVAGSGGQIATATTTGPVTFMGVPDASGSIVALSVHDPSDNSMICIDQAWVAPGAGWAAGQSPQLAYVRAAFVPVG